MNPYSERIKDKLSNSNGPSAKAPYLPEIDFIRFEFGGNPLQENQRDKGIEEESIVETAEEIPPPPPQNTPSRTTEDIMKMVNEAIAERRNESPTGLGPQKGVGGMPMYY